MKSFVWAIGLVGLCGNWAVGLPKAPVDPAHPGSQVYDYQSSRQDLTCHGRSVTVIVPEPKDVSKGEKFPVVVYGHGQALSLDHYLATFNHLAGKGVALIFPSYSNGFFDQDWRRMARDYVNIADCALNKFSANYLDRSKVVFSGHSKGAYVASIASGLAVSEKMNLQARATVLFATAGWDQQATQAMDPNSALTVIFSDRDSVVDKSHSDKIYNRSPAKFRQFIFVRSYGAGLEADHFWPLTKGSFFGGGPVSALHYFGAWKWLVAAAHDLNGEVQFTHPYLYGELAADKGVSNLVDEIKREF